MTKGYLFDEGDELILRKETAGGIVVHLSEEAEELSIGDETYTAYPADRTYKEVTENVSMLLDEGDGYTEVYHLGLFSDGSSMFTGYPYTVQFFSSDSLKILYAETETGTLYFIPQE